VTPAFDNRARLDRAAARSSQRADEQHYFVARNVLERGSGSGPLASDLAAARRNATLLRAHIAENNLTFRSL